MYKDVWKFTVTEEGFLLFLNFNCNLNLKLIKTLSNMPVGLYFILKYFPSLLSHT